MAITKLHVFSIPQDTSAICLNSFFVFSASPFEDCQWRRYVKVLFCKHGICFMLYFGEMPYQWVVLLSFRIFIIWTIGNEGIWYGWKTCCFWINHNAEHWRWGQDLKMSISWIIIVPYLLWRLFFTQHVFINCLCSSEVMKHVMWFLHLVTYSIFVMIYDVIHLQLCQATSS